jgi:septum formation topological specificity factor MinE
MEIEKLSLANLKLEILTIISKYCNENEELRKDLLQFIELIDNEQAKLNEIREFAFELANKL